MRSAHKMTGDEEDALTRAKRFYRWRPGARKAIKAQSHRKDRAISKNDIRCELRPRETTGE